MNILLAHIFVKKYTFTLCLKFDLFIIIRPPQKWMKEKNN